MKSQLGKRKVLKESEGKYLEIAKKIIAELDSGSYPVSFGKGGTGVSIHLYTPKQLSDEAREVASEQGISLSAHWSDVEEQTGYGRSDIKKHKYWTVDEDGDITPINSPEDLAKSIETYNPDLKNIQEFRDVGVEVIANRDGLKGTGFRGYVLPKDLPASTDHINIRTQAYIENPSLNRDIADNIIETPELIETYVGINKHAAKFGVLANFGKYHDGEGISDIFLTGTEKNMRDFLNDWLGTDVIVDEQIGLNESKATKRKVLKENEEVKKSVANIYVKRPEISRRAMNNMEEDYPEVEFYSKKELAVSAKKNNVTIEIGDYDDEDLYSRVTVQGTGPDVEEFILSVTDGSGFDGFLNESRKPKNKAGLSESFIKSASRFI